MPVATLLHSLPVYTIPCMQYSPFRKNWNHEERKEFFSVKLLQTLVTYMILP